MLTNARNLTLADLRQNFGLQPNTTDNYFKDWLDRLPPLEPHEIVALDRLATNYEYLTQSDSPLKEVIKLVVLSPLLDLAGFYNGREVLFLKLDRSKPQPQYLKSMAYRLLDIPQERIQILQALKYIGQQISGF
jgi:hypothetical protein